jgi:hypothetical protein
MKTTKINGLGSFGVYVDDFDWDSVDAWKELKELNLKSLLTVVRGNGTTDNFRSIIKNTYLLGTNRKTRDAYYIRKYGADFINKFDSWDENDKISFSVVKKWTMTDDYGLSPHNWGRVTGKRDAEGDLTGIFGDTELLWHSNESGTYSFSPLVALYGAQHMTTSATGFCQMTDWYEKQSQAFQSELKELVAQHKWKPKAIEPQADDRYEIAIKGNFAGGLDDTVEMPLVIKSPGGITGLHFSEHTIIGFKGMTQAESDKLVARIRSEVFNETYIYDHWWENDSGDLLLFDNSIMVHNRSIRPGLNMKQELSQRLGYRCPLDYAGMEDYNPYFQEPYISRRNESMKLILEVGRLNYLREMKITINELSGEERREFLSRFTKEQIKELLTVDPSYNNIASY